MKTIAIIACYDTKHQEIDFIRKRIVECGCCSYFIDVSTSPGFRSTADMTREQVAEAAGVTWSAIEGGFKHELLDVMAKGSAEILLRLYREKLIDGVISIGGLQNTMIGSAAMRPLPIGVPKIMVSTVACGQRVFDLIVGSKDITVMPAISDFGGMNVVSETVLDNAVAAVVGMVQYAGKELTNRGDILIAATMMGATDGVIRAVEELQDNGYSVLCCHSTGIGGKVMEELIESNTVNFAMDLTLHEVVYEYFGKGFGFGAGKRLESGVKKGIPMLVTPGGIEFICKWKHEFTEDDHRRKMIWHNAQLAHIKLSTEEIMEICKKIVDRLNRSEPNKVVVLMPTKGFRTFAELGEPLYDPQGDKIIIDYFASNLREDIPIRYVDASIIDPAFCKVAAEEMMKLIKRYVK